MSDKKDKRKSEGLAEPPSGSGEEDAKTQAGKGKEYEIPEKADDLDAILDELEAREKQAHSVKKKAAAKGKSKKTTAHRVSDKELLGRIEKKSKELFELNKKLASLDKEVKEYKDKWLRTLAEFENYRKRSRKEWELLQHKAKADVICEVLNIVDDFERAFSVVEGKESDFVEGIKMIYKSLLQSLAKFGVEAIEAEDKPFNPKYHMAIGQIESKGKESGQIVQVAQKGYLLHDTVIRPAKVIIAK